MTVRVTYSYFDQKESKYLENDIDVEQDTPDEQIIRAIVKRWKQKGYKGDKNSITILRQE